MTTSTPAVATEPIAAAAPHAVRRRDAGKTRQSLLQAARRRFARDGYASTTVRDIATDAGVNVALINRYFTSKEGLFEACLASVVEELDQPDPSDTTFDQMLRTLVAQIADSAQGERALQLLLLLRSSSDEQADRIRRQTLSSITQRMAAVVGWRDGAANSDDLLLRTQIAFSAALGVVLLRSTSGLEPLTGASTEQLLTPLDDALRALMLPLPNG